MNSEARSYVKYKTPQNFKRQNMQGKVAKIVPPLTVQDQVCNGICVYHNVNYYQYPLYSSSACENGKQ